MSSSDDDTPIHSPVTPQRGIASAALIITIGNLLARLLGMVREQLASYYFGTGVAIKPFAVADSMLTILYDLLISGAIASALVPVLSNFSAQDRRAEFRHIVGTLLSLTLLFVGCITLVLMILTPQLVRFWLFGNLGSSDTARTTQLGAAFVTAALGCGKTIDDAALLPQVVAVVRLILPAIILLGISAVLLAANYSLGRFVWPSISQAARNGAIILAAVTLAHKLGISSMVVGVLAGAVLLVVVQLPSLRDAMPRLSFDVRHPAIRHILRLYLPISLGLLANTIGQTIDRRLAWGQAGADALGAMRYATQLQQLVLGLVATGIALGALPVLSRQAERMDEEGFRSTFASALRMITVLITPAIFGLLALAAPLVRILFQHGATTTSGTRTITIALLWYLPGTFFAAYDQLLINVFYARRNTLTPQIVGAIAVALYIGIELALVDRFGMVALVGAVSAQWMFHALVMFWLSRNLLGATHRRAFGRVLGICLGLSIAMAVFVLGVFSLVSRVLPGPQIVRDIAALAAASMAGVAFYAWTTARLDVPDVLTLARALSGKARRR